MQNLENSTSEMVAEILRAAAGDVADKCAREAALWLGDVVKARTPDERAELVGGALSLFALATSYATLAGRLAPAECMQRGEFGTAMVREVARLSIRGIP